jgi:hypothetical protein
MLQESTSTDPKIGYKTALKKTEAKVFLFSGGGNDLLHSVKMNGVTTGNLYLHLNSFTPGMSAHQCINSSLFKLIDKISTNIENLFRDVISNSNVEKIIFHGYGYAIPGHKHGKDLWLADPMDRRGIPNELGFRREIVNIMMDYFNKNLQKISNSSIRYINFRSHFVEPNWWHDPIHLTEAGYKLAANEFRKENLELHSGFPIS